MMHAIALAMMLWAADTRTPQQMTEQVVATLRSLNGADSAKSPAGDAEARLTPYFDFDALAASALTPHRKAFTQPQLRRATAAFRALLLLRTQESGKKLTGVAQVAPARAVKQTCVVDVTLADDDAEDKTQVAFIWRLGTQGWRVIDLALDGASVAKEYENQFGRMLRHDGPQKLIDKLEQRAHIAHVAKP